MAQFNITLTTEHLHGLFLSDGRDEAFAKLLEEILNQVLLAQPSEQICADRYERTDERVAYRNGFRNRQMTTRVGALTLGAQLKKQSINAETILAKTNNRCLLLPVTIFIIWWRRGVPPLYAEIKLSVVKTLKIQVLAIYRKTIFYKHHPWNRLYSHK